MNSPVENLKMVYLSKNGRCLQQRVNFDLSKLESSLSIYWIFKKINFNLGQKYCILGLQDMTTGFGNIILENPWRSRGLNCLIIYFILIPRTCEIMNLAVTKAAATGIRGQKVEFSSKYFKWILSQLIFYWLHIIK